jgi:hypothetical protein
MHRPTFHLYAGQMLRLSFAHEFECFGRAELPSRQEALADSAAARPIAGFAACLRPKLAVRHRVSRPIIVGVPRR